MRKVIVQMSVSLDGFVATTDHDLEWIFPQFDDATLAWVRETIQETDTQLIGRVNYLEQAAHWPRSTEGLAPLLNAAEKIVFSRTLERLSWRNSRLATGDPATEIARLKRLPGRHVLVPGGAGFVRGLVDAGLVDEYRLIVHPVALGAGLAIFPRRLKLRLIDQVRFATGAVALTLRPADRDHNGQPGRESSAEDPL